MRDKGLIILASIALSATNRPGAANPLPHHENLQQQFGHSKEQLFRNEVTTLVGQWFWQFDSHQPLEQFLEHQPDDGFLISFPELDLRNKRDFTLWFETVKDFETVRRDLSNLTVSVLGDDAALVRVDVDRQSSARPYAHHQASISPDYKTRIPHLPKVA